MDHDYGATDQEKLRDLYGNKDSRRALSIQLAISVVFGLAAFLAFCLLRPRWTSLYAARKKRKSEAAPLPQLPKSFFGWIPVVWRITDDEVLASAGLDAYAFLAFFKLALKYVTFLFFFALAVIFPIIRHYESDDPGDDEKKGKKPEKESSLLDLDRRDFQVFKKPDNETLWPPWSSFESNDYLWVYLIFVYLFSAVGVYLIVTETQKMIRVRQKYLAAQSSVSDRTIRLSGIPEDMRAEEKIKETIENLEIGKVESVQVCKNWAELDDLIEEREGILHHLEGAWTEYLGERKASRKMKRRYRDAENGTGGDEEQAALLSGDDMDDGAHVMAYNKPRPEKRLWYGFLNLQSRKVDAIDYYEEKLRRLDERIRAARKKEYTAMPLAFVTLDSTAACQMACQAIIDPQPMQLLAQPSPSPSGVVWRNTYLTRKTRMFRAWSITVFIFVLTIFWSFLLLPLAGIQTIQNIRTIFPGLADLLEEHDNLRAVVNTGVPTLLLAILNSAVPYFYEYLSHLQGMTSVGDIETSLISKNFFFTFFNLFVVFTVLGTTGRAAALFDEIDAHLRDLPKIAWTLAQGLSFMSSFYLNYIVLQAFGLFPFRLLQFGSVALYPWYYLRAKTPRDYSQLTQPGTFTYGIFIPQTLFIFIICTVYSVSKDSEKIQALGLVYFGMGSFIYKYQLLYAMDNRQFSSGRAWPMMCVRFAVGLVVFQLVMAGRLAIRKALVRSALVAPLIVATVCFIFWYRRTYEPLMRNIALRTLRDVHDEFEARMAESILSGDFASPEEEDDPQNQSNSSSRFRWPDLGIGATAGAGGSSLTPGYVPGGGREARSRFVNPSMVRPLEEPWIARTAERDAELNGSTVLHGREGENVEGSHQGQAEE